VQVTKESIIRNHQILEKLELFIEEDARSKLGAGWNNVIDISNWTRELPSVHPIQQNSDDCGVYTIKFAELAAVNKPMIFPEGPEGHNMDSERRQVTTQHVPEWHIVPAALHCFALSCSSIPLAILCLVLCQPLLY
jgi:Ulp1 family protease